MGKKILNGEQIERGLKVKLLKNFGSIPVDSIATLIDYDLDEDFTIISIVLNWEKNGTFPYVTFDVSNDMNIVNFLEIID